MTKQAHKHMLWAMIFGILSLGISITIKISADTTSVNTSTSTTNSTTVVDCSYETGNWSDCSSSGIQTRTVTSSPDGCITTSEAPEKKRSCTYTAPVTACTYTYSSWSECSSSGKKTRTIASRTPSGCIDSAVPILSQSCTYVSSTTTETSTACAYTLSDWSTCNTSEIQTRTILSKSPSGCIATDIPTLQRTCTYTTSTTSSDDTSNDTNTATSTSIATSNSSGTACAYTLSDWSTCNSDGKQTRTIKSRIPSGCSDYSIPELSRYCTAVSSTESTTTSSSVTPEFNFLNINGGEVISGTVQIQGTVASAYTVELYLVPTDSNISKYLGIAKRNSNNIWEYSFNSETQPNGSYYLKTKIKNVYGSYDGGQRMIVILNSTADDSTNSTTPESAVTSEIASESNSTQKASPDIDQTDSEWQKKYFKSEICKDQNICGGMADPDKDGLNNNDEHRYGTSPTNPDSDGDGFLDGDEIKGGFNPLKAAPGDKSDKIVFESPKESGEVKEDLYEVKNVEIFKNENGENNLKISGKGIPNSFVTVYVYSDPIIFTIKTDAEGNWSYVLDKDVEDGEHQVYVAVTDNIGKITSKSTAMGFVKTAQAVNIIPPAEAASSAKAISPTSRWYQEGIFFYLSITLAGLALALASVGLVKHHIAIKKMGEPTSTDN